MAKGPIKLRVVAQLANDGDNVNDATEEWPADRTLTDLGDRFDRACAGEREGTAMDHLRSDPASGWNRTLG